MRRGRDNGWLLSEDGVLVGVNLGADFCAEHEWGITRLKQRLGTPRADEESKYERKEINWNGIYGIERRRCNVKEDGCVALKEEGDTLNLIVTGQYSLKHMLEEPLDRPDSYRCEWKFWQNEEIVTAWDEESCMIRVKGEENFKKLREIHAQLLKGNVAVWLGGGGVFQNAGLCFAIIDKIPAERLKEMAEADLDREKLLAAAEKTGIEKKINEANEQRQKMEEVETGRRSYERKFAFYALSPRWAHPQERKTTKHPVVFWLNPQQQDVYDFGWFSVEDLEQWLKGKGPVVKASKENRRKR